MSISSDTRVGDVATLYPLTTRVFARHGIDFCCGGGKPLSEACGKAGIPVETVLADLDTEIGDTGPTQDGWDRKSPDALIEHIIAAYHRPLDEELPRLDGLARKVNMVHGDKQPEMLGGIESTFAALRIELETHMAKEEDVLFPMLLESAAGPDSAGFNTIAELESEHENAGAVLRRLRELTNDYAVPEGACNSWRALWAGLEALETSLHEHIHLENNILFPRTAQSK